MASHIKVDIFLLITLGLLRAGLGVFMYVFLALVIRNHQSLSGSFRRHIFKLVLAIVLLAVVAPQLYALRSEMRESQDINIDMSAAEIVVGRLVGRLSSIGDTAFIFQNSDQFRSDVRVLDPLYFQRQTLAPLLGVGVIPLDIPERLLINVHGGSLFDVSFMTGVPGNLTMAWLIHPLIALINAISMLLMIWLSFFFANKLDLPYPTYKVLFAWCLWSKAMHRFDRRICISNTMIRFYERQFPGLSFDLAYNFRSDHGEKYSLPNPEAINWIQKQRSGNRIVLLYAGSLSSRKNTNALLDAVLSSNDLSLMICGEGPERIAMSQKVELRSPENQVFFAGHVNNVKSFLNQCDMLVLPSHAEGLPLVVLEAASLGIPSLMSNLAIHRELASKGFGETFNRHSFFDLRHKALLLKADRTLDSDTRRVNLWKAQFSPLAGFGQYEKIFDYAK